MEYHRNKEAQKKLLQTSYTHKSENVDGTDEFLGRETYRH